MPVAFAESTFGACGPNRPAVGRGVLTAPRWTADVRSALALATTNGAAATPRHTNDGTRQEAFPGLWGGFVGALWEL
jgi:hypothetical protein